MLAFAEWDEERHKAILGRALKGDAVDKLAQALHLVKDKITPEMFGQTVVPAGQEQAFKETIMPSIATTRRMVTEMEAVLSKPAVRKHGIDYQSFKQLLSSAAHNPIFNIDEAVAEGEAIQNKVRQAMENSAQPLKDMKHDVADSMESMMARYLLAMFSMALAVQENRVGEYADLSIEMCEKSLRAGHLAAQQEVAAIDDPKVDRKTMAALPAISMEVTLLAFLNEAQNERNPFADVYQAIILGKDYPKSPKVKGAIELTRDYMAQALDVDTATHSGQAAVRSFEEHMFRQLSAQIGKPLPLPPDMVGRPFGKDEKK